MNTKSVIDLILSQQTIAVAGVSRKSGKFSNILFENLRRKGYQVIPINPNAETIGGVKCLQAIDQLPPEVSTLVVITPKTNTESAVAAAIQKGIANIWIQNGCETPSAIELAKRGKVNLIHNACVLMYATPTGIHKFHKCIAKWTGSYIKE